MRVATNQFSNSLINQLGQLSSRQVRLQTEAATGKRVQNASDDPVAARRLLDLQAQAGSIAQYQKNIGQMQDVSTATFSTLRAVQKVSNRAGEIATLADGMRGSVELEAYAGEVNKLIQQAVGELNRKQGDSYLFGGTRSDQAPFSMETDASGLITGVSYNGNSEVNPGEVAKGVTVSVNVPGANDAGDGARGLVTDPRSGADFFRHLISLRDHLLAGDTRSIAETDRPDLQRDEDNFLYHVGEIGATQARLETAVTAAEDLGTELTSQTSQTGDADLAETLVRLNEAQTAYQATLQSAAKIMGMSLMDFLR